MAEPMRDEDVSARLTAALPHWTLQDGTIRRRYTTEGWKSALMVVAAVGHLAEAAWHHPEVRASYGWVEVHLHSHDAGGVTERDLQLAERIEDVIAWRPEADSPLTGPPDDPRFRYVLPD